MNTLAKYKVTSVLFYLKNYIYIYLQFLYKKYYFLAYTSIYLLLVTVILNVNFKFTNQIKRT